ncbi:hypothetical protein KUV65_06700 [Maritalea mobilis]|uniref:hypothetical protein n=1 Tax=Maritalea mobilis TaxID=483324 RepID=UPI001C9556A6|nr:hypothetical protein [Maritalea mobilis]MBY6201043.1 hypothetical protein [Maritalea mobilis]
MNWTRANFEQKIRDQGYAPVDEPGPRNPPPKGKKTKRTNVAPAGTTKWKKKNQTLQERRDATRLNYIKAVAAALAAGKPLPNPFKKMHPSVKKEVRAVGPEAWVLAQPELCEHTAQSAGNAKIMPHGERAETIAALQAEIRDLTAQRENLARQYHILGERVITLRNRLKSIS